MTPQEWRIRREIRAEGYWVAAVVLTVGAVVLVAVGERWDAGVGAFVFVLLSWTCLHRADRERPGPLPEKRPEGDE